MAKTLVIVESPAKAKTIAKFLGRNYRLAASMGHIRDLPRSQFGVDVENDFTPKYITIRGKGKILQDLRQKARQVDRILVATDPDREGEAIAWHLAVALDLDPSADLRIVFHEITRDTVKASVKKPRTIDQRLVDAQQARRILDRLVGYELSPFLWRKVRRGLSAGRVQSVAVRMICDREREIETFRPEEYWSLTAELVQRDHESDHGARLVVAKYYGDMHGKRELPNQESVRELLTRLEGASFRVKEVRKRERRRQPAAPFTTSTLQQEASRKLNFTVRRTMRAAQQLYEGLEIPGEGTVGLITYMRTDSTRVSAQAVEEATAWIHERFGREYSQRRLFGKQRQQAQDAHEAIRPTSALRHPDAIKESLTPDQYRLYRLIWERFVASQMRPALMDTVTADIEANGQIFRATGSTIRFPGFMLLYVEGSDEESAEEEKTLPPLQVGELLGLLDLKPKQHFTQPPPRYTEAMLVKALEEHGIGRPSTYAPIIETIQERGYVRSEKRRFHPTELGIAVTDLLKENFPEIVDIEFTAHMEAELDRIEEGRHNGRELLRNFYQRFQKSLREAEAQAERVELPEEETDEICEKCGRKMIVKHGRFGRFIACPGYPECKNTKPFLEKVGVQCPDCGREIVVRRSRKGRVFYGCSGFPECRFVSWHRPANRTCPQCGAFLVHRQTKSRGHLLQCSRKDCGYEEAGTPPKTGSPSRKETDAGLEDGKPNEVEARLAEMAAEIVRSTV